MEVISSQTSIVFSGDLAFVRLILFSFLRISNFFQVIEGLLQAHPSVITSREHCAKLLGHEASRVLHDRLTNDTDRRYFYRVLSEQLHDGFKTRWIPEELEKTPLIFGDFLEGGSPQSVRAYRFVRQYDRLPQILEVSLPVIFVSLSNLEPNLIFSFLLILYSTLVCLAIIKYGLEWNFDCSLE